MSVPIRNRQSVNDPIARAYKRAGLFRVTFGMIGALALIGLLGWVFLFSSVFAVTDIRVSGAASVGDDRVRLAVEELLNRRTFRVLQPAKNIILLDAGAVSSGLADSFTAIERAEIRKQFPHTIAVVVTERVAFGLWCRGSTCSYFDRSGARWGSAVPSRGPLLVRVQDERTEASGSEQLVEGILAAVDGLPALGLLGVSVTLPDSAPGDMRVSVSKKYDLLLDAFGDLSDQLATLGVLLSDRAKDPGWAPQYIDLRTPGRAYYR